MKHYVVLKGHTTWIFTNRNECKNQVDGFLWAVYKSFWTKEAAEFARQEQSFWEKWKSSIKYLNTSMWYDFSKSICTDAACPSNPWPIEYRWVVIENNKEIFNYGPYAWWSVNIAEFLGIIEWLKRLKKNKKYNILYTDSITALWRVQKNSLKTTIKQTSENKKLFEQINEAIQRLNDNSEWKENITIKKRPTTERGQIPADFWRK